MSFPSDYKIVQQPGATSGVIAVQLGLARQILINTSDWSIHVMDGITQGGFKVVPLHALDDYLQNPLFLPTGSQLDVEVGDDDADSGTTELTQGWKASVLKAVFQKLADTSTAGSWFIKDLAMPATMRNQSKAALDLNTIETNGFYTVDPSVASNMPGAVDTGNSLNLAMLVLSQSLDNLIQILYARDNTGKIWTRVQKDNVWQAWVLTTGVTAADLLLKVDRSGTLAYTGIHNHDGFGVVNLGQVNEAQTGDDENDLINGDFDYAQRALTQTISGYGSDDRWSNEHAGSTKVHSLQPFAIGQTAVPGNPTNYSRTVVTSVAGASNLVAKSQRIESVRRSAGKRKTLTFYSKADSAKDIAVEFSQNFGTGGSPSATVTAIGVSRKTLSTGWTRYDVQVDIPSIAGKTLGTANNDYLAVIFWFDAGATFNARTLSLGQQNGTFEIAHVSLRNGDRRKEPDPFIRRSPQAETAALQRFFEIGNSNLNVYAAVGNPAGVSTPFKVSKRSTPTIATLSASYGNCSSGTITALGAVGVLSNALPSSTGQIAFDYSWSAEAEL